jgi:hypothetical protein
MKTLSERIDDAVSSYEELNDQKGILETSECIELLKEIQGETVTLWACIWKDSGEIVEELSGGSVFFHIFRTRKEAMENVREDRKVQKIRVSISKI